MDVDFAGQLGDEDEDDSKKKKKTKEETTMASREYGKRSKPLKETALDDEPSELKNISISEHHTMFNLWSVMNRKSRRPLPRFRKQRGRHPSDERQRRGQCSPCS